MTSFIDRWPTLATLKTEITGRILGNRSDAGMGPGSDGALLRDVLAHVTYGLHLHLRYGVLYQLIPTKANGVYLDAWAYLFGLSDGSGGFGRIKARGSTATDGVEVTATAATGDLQDEQFTDGSGTTYKIDETHSFRGPGSAILDVAAVDTGDITNIDTTDSETLTWVSTPANMSSTITQQKDFTGGADKEEDAALRSRLQKRLQTPPKGGNWAQWVEWIEETSPGELRAYVWPQRQYTDETGGDGAGTVDYLALRQNESGTDQHILSTDDLYTEISDEITDNAPVLMMKNSRQLTVTATTQLIELDVQLATTVTDEDRCDWDAEDLDTTVFGYSAPTYEIRCNADVHNHLESGDLVIVDEYELEADSVGTGDGLSDDSYFTVTTWPWGTSGPSAGKHIMSGGGVIKKAVDAVRDYCDSLGPAAGTYAAPISGWDDTMRIAGIKTAIIQACDGKVVDATMIAPAADVSPGYDDDSDVERLVPSEIVVWEPK
jgi:uncharacterized phage protein gp47/JayE